MWSQNKTADSNVGGVILPDALLTLLPHDGWVEEKTTGNTLCSLLTARLLVEGTWMSGPDFLDLASFVVVRATCDKIISQEERDQDSGSRSGRILQTDPRRLSTWLAYMLSCT